MNPRTTISVYQIAGGPLCVASGDGQKVFERIKRTIEAGGSVNVSFEDVTAVASAFLNSALGQLYGTFDEECIRSRIKIIDIKRSDLRLLVAVIRTAKVYFKNKEGFDRAIREELGEDDSAE